MIILNAFASLNQYRNITDVNEDGNLVRNYEINIETNEAYLRML